MTLDQLTNQAIADALERNNWNVTHAARELGISPRTIQRRRPQLRHGVELTQSVSMSDNSPHASPERTGAALPSGAEFA